VRDIVHQVIVADATNKDILQEYAKDVDFAVVCLGERIDSSLLIAHFLKEIGVKKIIAKATSNDHGEMLKIIGADEIIFPESDAAKRLATSLVSPDILEFIKLSADFDIVEIAAPDRFVGQSIRDLQLRNKYGMEILAIKNALTGETQIMPPADFKLKPDDILIVIGEVDSLKKFSL